MHRNPSSKTCSAADVSFWPIFIGPRFAFRTSIVAEDSDKPFVLIIDDDQRILRALRLILRNDYEVLLASSLSEARTQLASARVDVVVCDQRMPDGLGSDF